jgi:hypothetical protein
VNLIKYIRTYTGFPGKYPPIYTIFSGNAINAGNGVYMQAMADSTGGTYTQVTPGDVTQITLVMNQILGSISKSSKPASVSLTVNGVSYSGTTAIQQSGGAQVTFSSSMPLLSGDNSAQLKVEFIDSVGVSQTHTSSFTLQVNATAEDTGAFPIDTIFSGVCAVANTITVNGLINPLLATSKTLAQIPHLLTDSLNQLSLQLQANRFTSSTAQLLVTSRRTGDSVRYSLPVTSSSGKYLRDLPVQIVGQDSLGIPKQGIRTDSLLQAAPFDTLDLWWQNPTDARDTIRSSLLFYRTPKIDFVGDTLSVEQIKAMVSDASVTGQSVVVEYRWLTGDSVSTGNLLRKDSSLSFLGMTNFHTELQSMLSDRLVVSYIDPVFHTVYLDTAFLLPVDNKITVNGLVNPLLVTGATFVRTPYILTDSLNQLTLQLQSNRYISSSAQLLLISRRTGDSVSVRLTSTSTSGGYQGDLPVQFLGQDTLGNPNRGIRTDSLLQSSPFDTLDLRWQNPTDARDTVRASVLFYRTPKVAFTSDTLDIGKINVHITDASALGLTVTVDYQWLTSDTISKGTLPRTDSSLSFYGFANLHAKLLSTKDNGLIVIYTDPIFDIVYRDTVYLTYPRPAVPVA